MDKNKLVEIISGLGLEEDVKEEFIRFINENEINAETAGKIANTLDMLADEKMKEGILLQHNAGAVADLIKEMKELTQEHEDALDKAAEDLANDIEDKIKQVKSGQGQS